MNQPALSFFETHDSEATATAIGPESRHALREGKNGNSTGGEEVLLGQLLWFSVSDAVRLTPERLREAMRVAGLDAERLAPGAPTAASALSRAAELAEVRLARLERGRSGEEIEEELYANVLFRTAARGIKQAVTEILDAAENRLSYEPLAALAVEDGAVRVEPLSERRALRVEEDALLRLRRAFAFEKGRHDGEAVRRVIERVRKEAVAVPLRNSGGMYFLPNDNPAVKRLLRFVEEVRVRAQNAPGRTARASNAMSVPLVDRDASRRAVAESLEEYVEKEAKALVAEMSQLLKSGRKVKKGRAEALVGRVRRLKEGVADYEELLQTQATAARANLDVAAKEARAILERVGT